MAEAIPDDALRVRRVAERLGVSAVRWTDEGGRSPTPERWGWYSVDYPDEGLAGGGFYSELEALRDGIQMVAADRTYCVRCGCTNDDPCDGGCYWVGFEISGEMADVCSACVEA